MTIAGKPTRRHQRGITTMVVALLLLAILTVVVIFATSVGLFEQRTATNDVRAKLVQQASEANLNIGIEFFKANARFVTSRNAVNGWLGAGKNYWVRCTDAGPCLAEPDAARRANMWVFTNVHDSAEFQAMVEPLVEVGAAAGGDGFAVDTLRVHALLCAFPTYDETLPPGTVQECVPDDLAADGVPVGGQQAITLVAEATISGENANAVVKQSIATFRTIPGPPNVPIIASGSVNAAGNMNIVPNPNGGGPGIPLSIWTNSDFDVAGSGASFDTCHLGDFIANPGGGQGGGPRQDEDTGAWLCETCDCQNLQVGKGKISSKLTGGGAGASMVEGIDVLDVDGNDGDLPDNSYFPAASDPRLDDLDNVLDDSLFEYIFGVDVGDIDAGAFVRHAAVDGLYPDEIFLKQNADTTDCSAATQFGNGGFFWAVNGSALDDGIVQPNACTLSGQIGTASEPVVLVVDDVIRLNNAVVYGLLFIRDNPRVDLSCGSSASLCINGSATIYGSIVVEGDAKLTGGATVVYSEAVLNQITTSPAFLRYGVVPGTWSDIHTAGEVSP